MVVRVLVTCRGGLQIQGEQACPSAILPKLSVESAVDGKSATPTAALADQRRERFVTTRAAVTESITKLHNAFNASLLSAQSGTSTPHISLMVLGYVSILAGIANKKQMARAGRILLNAALTVVAISSCP